MSQQHNEQVERLGEESAGRRSAMLSLGAASLAMLTGAGLADAANKKHRKAKKTNNGKHGKHGKHGRKGKRVGAGDSPITRIDGSSRLGRRWSVG